MTTKAFIIGDPIKHSRSPLIHGHWLKTHGLDGSYERIHVKADELPAFFDRLRAGEWTGGNVTIPHKEAVFSLADEIDEAAMRVGAVNTLWLNQGKILATNTDWSGFADNLSAKAPQWKSGKTALVLGAGGGSRAVIFACLHTGYERIIVANRTLARAEQIADAFGKQVEAIEFDRAQEFLADADLIVNTTSLGMQGQPPLELDLVPCKASAVATDIVYIPLMTPFLQAAHDRGLQIVDGLGMLLHQAVPGFEIWFGKRPVVDDELRRLIEADMGLSS